MKKVLFIFGVEEESFKKIKKKKKKILLIRAIFPTFIAKSS